MVLLHLLRKLSADTEWKLTLAHFNHKLRGPSSDADERFVVRTATKLGLPVHTGRGNVRGFAKQHKLSLEQAARELRHRFLADTAIRLGIGTIALAHHADDRLELFFLRLFRGSGSEGLVGMKWRNPSPVNGSVEIVRPLLGETKGALEAWARAHCIPFREDVTNASRDILRNRVRHDLLPLLRRRYQPALDKTISRVLDILGPESDFVNRAAMDWLQRMRRPTFDRLSVALQRRSVHLQLLQLQVTPDYDLIEYLRLNPGRNVSISPIPSTGSRSRTTKWKADALVPTNLVRDADGRVRFSSIVGSFQPGALRIQLNDKSGAAEFGGVRVSWRVAGERGKWTELTPMTEGFDADAVGCEVVLRHWQPGDRFQPIGMKHSLKLQDFFTNQKVPATERRRLVLATTLDGEVFWVEGLRISERFKLKSNTIRRLQWSWRRL
jgi:tRNA(Ile)-lysidine synthase